MITPFTRLEAYEATPQAGDETIEINGFRVNKDDKPRNIVLVKYKSACMGEIADAATKALGVEVSEKHITNLFWTFYSWDADLSFPKIHTSFSNWYHPPPRT